MSEARTILVGRIISGAAVVLGLAGFAILTVRREWDLFQSVPALENGVAGVGFGALAWTMMRTQFQNRVVWILAVTGLCGSLTTLILGLVSLSEGSDFTSWLDDPTASPAGLPLGPAIGLTLALVLWIGPFIAFPALALLVFPDGTLPSPRWRWLARYNIATIALSVLGSAILFHPRSTQPIDTFGSALGQVVELMILLAAIGAIASMASLVVRYRRSGTETRHQIRWVAYGAATLVLSVVGSFVIWGGVSDTGAVLPRLMGPVGLLALLASFWVAITKNHLYDIDLFISRTLTYGALAAFITGVYAMVVVGVGSLLEGSGDPNLVLSVAAVALVAVAFEPLRNRVQHAANHLVYGKRATPYEVLSRATSRLADAGSPEQTLQQITRLVVDGTGAAEAVLWLRIGDHLQPHAATPNDALSGLHPVEISDGQLPDVAGEASVPVRHRGDFLGVLSITKPRGQSITAADEKVLADVAAGSGLVLRNMRLNVELSERAEQLRISRRRLVAAHDDERHRLERDLHDGAQQQVVALKVKLGVAKTIADREGAQAVVKVVEGLASTTQHAVDAMRVVAHGIYPPLLEAEGLEPALSAARRKFSTPIQIEFEGVRRYDRSTEESVYFCLVDIIARAVDRGATTVDVVVLDHDQSMLFTVRHDGETSDLVAVTDRVDALSGTLTIEGCNEMTVVSCRLPVAESVLEPA